MGWVHSFFDQFFVIQLGKALKEMKALKQNEILKIIFLIYSLHFIWYFKMDKTGVIYMSITFHSHITSKNWLKMSSQTKQKNPLFCLRAFVLQDFLKWIKYTWSTCLYLSIAILNVKISQNMTELCNKVNILQKKIYIKLVEPFYTFFSDFLHFA